MKEIKIKNETYSLPTSWDEITVNQLVKIEQLNQEEVSLNKMTKIASILVDVEEDTLLNIEIADYMTLLQDISELMNSTTPNSKFQPKITLDGVTYTAVEVQEWNTREFTDFDTLSSDKTNLPLLLALIYRVEGEELTSENYTNIIKDRAKKFENLPASVAIGAISFFSNSLLLYINNILSSSEVVREKMNENPKVKEAMNQLTTLIDGAGL